MKLGGSLTSKNPRTEANDSVCDPPKMTNNEVGVMINSGEKAGIMVMSAPTDRLYQRIKMNHSTSRSETIALSYGCRGERPSRPVVAFLPDLGDTAGQRLRARPGL